MTDRVPSGVLAVLVDKTGRVVATGCDFSQDRPGGFSLFEAQASRARQRMALNLVKDYCSSDIAAVMEGYEPARLARLLVERRGYTETVMPVGGEE